MYICVWMMIKQKKKVAMPRSWSMNFENMMAFQRNDGRNIYNTMIVIVIKQSERFVVYGTIFFSVISLVHHLAGYLFVNLFYWFSWVSQSMDLNIGRRYFFVVLVLDVVPLVIYVRCWFVHFFFCIVWPCFSVLNSTIECTFKWQHLMAYDMGSLFVNFIQLVATLLRLIKVFKYVTWKNPEN